MKKGRTGMTTFFTTLRTMFWNSWSTAVMVPALVHTAAKPMRTENTRALMTGMIWGMSSWKATPGSSFNPSMLEAMGRKGTST